MAAERPGDWQDLNAHVDGELDAAHQAHMAERIAEDRDLARSAAALARLRAETANAFLAEAAGIASPRLPAPPLVRRQARRWLLAAAALLVLLAGIGWQVLLRPGSDPAIEAHLRWVDTPPAAAETVVRAKHPGFPVDVPSLEAAGLRTVRASMEGEALHIGYLGPRGCRVSLWIAPGQDNAAFAIEPRDSLLVARWSSRGFAYSVIAGGMPASRFSRIATALHQASIAPYPAGARLAEGGARESEARCLG